MGEGVNVPEASNIMLSPSTSKSCSSSKRTPWGSSISVPLSSWIPSLKVPSCSCVSLITSSKVVSRTFFVASQDLTVPVCVVKVFAAANVPDTSLTIKWARIVASGGFALLYLNPVLFTLRLFTAPISVVVAKSFAEEPPVVVTPTVGRVE